MGYSNAAFHLEFSDSFFGKSYQIGHFGYRLLFLKDNWDFRLGFFFQKSGNFCHKINPIFLEKLFELDAFFGGITQTYPDRLEYNGILQREVERAAAFFKKSIFIWMTSGCSSSDCRKDNRCFHIHIAWSNCWVHSWNSPSLLLHHPGTKCQLQCGLK